MTDKEIIKALEKCATQDCDNCPSCNAGLPCFYLYRKTLDLIKKQQLQIDRLTTEKDNLIKTYAECQIDFLNAFVNKLKTWHCYEKYDIAGHKGRHIAISEVSLNRLVKEMTRGAENENISGTFI